MVSRICRIVDGVEIQRAIPDEEGMLHCYPEGQTMKKFATLFDNLNDAARYLIKDKRTRIRMEPGNALIVDNIYIDKKRREVL
mgnify:CR=1 FL=1|tara:strand:+ start:1087 stop:1335 length:249 start_codon:yes stop_codon:yes gene_type:complete